MGDRGVMVRFSERRWRSAHRRVWRETFRTVPFYRERWALAGAGPVAAAVVQERRRDLVPLAGGALGTDGWSGFAPVVAMIGRRRTGTLLAVLTDLPPTLAAPVPPRGVRLRCLPPGGRAPNPFDPRFVDAGELARHLGRGGACAVLGPPSELAALAVRTGLFEPSDVEGDGSGRPALTGSERRITPLPVYSARSGLPTVARPGAVLHDGLLGYLAVVRECGRWHLDWRRVHAADVDADAADADAAAAGAATDADGNSAGGAAFTLLRQRSPRLVDVLAGPNLRVDRCSRHRTPVLVRRVEPTASER